MFLLQLLLFLTLHVVATHFLHKFRNLPPTPFPNLPIIGHLHLFKKPLHKSLSKLSRQYGPILFLQLGSRKVLVISSPSAAEECFTKDIVFANRPRLIAGKHLGYNFRILGWAPYGDYWRNLRKISALEIFSAHRLQLLSGIRSDEVKLMIQRLYKNNGKVVNMKVVLFELAMNVMMRMIARKRYYGDDVADAEEARNFQDIVKETFRLSGSKLADFLPIVGLFGHLEKQLIELQKRRDEFIQDLIEQRRRKLRTDSEKQRSPCMVDVLLGLQESEPEQYDDVLIKSLVLNLLSAGTDATASTIEWNMSVLLNNPEIMKKAQDEIDLVVGEDRLVNESDMAKLPYLHCIIKETSRLYPVAPLLVPHESSEECKVGGYGVPKGTMLLVNMWGIQRDPTIWENPTEFKPERFQGHEGTREGFKMVPFGSGRRNCPGEGLAVRMVGLGLASLLQCFEWKRVGEEMVDMAEGNGLTMPKDKPLEAVCNPRPKMVKLFSEI